MKYLAKIALWCLKKADDKTKKEVLTETVKDLFCVISSEDILKYNTDGTMRFEDKLLDSSYRKELKIQADVLENMMLWKILQKDIKYQIQKKMWNEANGDLDNVWWKLMTFYNDIIKSRIEQFRK